MKRTLGLLMVLAMVSILGLASIAPGRSAPTKAEPAAVALFSPSFEVENQAMDQAVHEPARVSKAENLRPTSYTGIRLQPDFVLLA